jgi:hypothetical protein
MLKAAGSALVANSIKEMQMQHPNQPLPEIIRVEALKGFRAVVNGQFGVVNPGDVVEVPLQTAIDLRVAKKAVMTDKDLKRQKDYLPERKRPKDQARTAPKGG